LFTQTGCCPYIKSIKIIPSNPTTTDLVKIVTETMTPSLGNEVSYSFTKQADTFNLLGCFYAGPLTQPQTFMDTTIIGILAEGMYRINYTGRLSNSSTMCSVTDSKSMTTSFQVIKTVGFEAGNNINKQFNIYPNPVTNLLTIRHDEMLGNNQLELTNYLGQVCYRTSFNKETTIDMTLFSNGVYIISITNGKDTLFYKVIKQ
jgi:hypothetical protein